MWEMGHLFRSHTSNFSANMNLKEFTQVGDKSGHRSRLKKIGFSAFYKPNASYSYLAFPFPFCCAAPALSAAAALVQSKTTIVFGQPLPGLLACYSAFCLLCRSAKLALSCGRNGRFIINNGAHWE
jgi:hypothetical protein